MLMLHCGARSIKPEALASIPVVRPERAGKVWKGIQHGDFRDALAEAIDATGLELKDEKWGVGGADDSDLWGAMTIRDPKRLLPKLDKVVGGAEYSLGARHSNSQAFAASVVSGCRIFVCDNGCISGDHVLKRKHTTGLEVYAVAKEAVDLWLNKSRDTVRTFERLAEFDLSGNAGEDRVNKTLIGLGEAGVVGWGKVGAILREWRAPRHDAFKPRNGWSLYNCATESAKAFSPQRQIAVLNGARRWILEDEVKEEQHQTVSVLN
jgi:hypothetical protein